MQGKLVILSAPSGAGKSTIISHLLRQGFGLKFSVSATNRKKRKGETHGKDYYFLDTQEFRKKIDNGEFLEWEEVYKDVFYGTLTTEVERLRNNGNHVIFDVDIAGGITIKNVYGKDALSLFIKPPSLDELERRLIARNDGTNNIPERIQKAKTELTFENKFDHVIINDNLDHALEEATRLVGDYLVI